MIRSEPWSRWWMNSGHRIIFFQSFGTLLESFSWENSESLKCVWASLFIGQVSFPTSLSGRDFRRDWLPSLMVVTANPIQMDGFFPLIGRLQIVVTANLIYSFSLTWSFEGWRFQADLVPRLGWVLLSSLGPNMFGPQRPFLATTVCPPLS